jgi:hypothetical protein
MCLNKLPSGCTAIYIPNRLRIGLEFLELGDNNFVQTKRLPPAIATATNLKELCLAKNSKVLLRKVDADDVLALPRLRRLSLGVPPAPSVYLYLLKEAPQLEVIQ